jgi:hypothetical protein
LTLKMWMAPIWKWKSPLSRVNLQNFCFRYPKRRRGCRHFSTFKKLKKIKLPKTKKL